MLEDYHTPPSPRFSREFSPGREIFKAIPKMWLSVGSRRFGGHEPENASAEIAPTKRVRKAKAVDMVEVLMCNYNNQNID